MRFSRVSILIYHRVLAEPDPLQPEIVTADVFARHMRWLRRFFRIVSLPEAVARMQENGFSAPTACVTFDDGYADNAEVALPILERLRMPATFFVASGFLDGGRMWNDTVIESIRRWPDPTVCIPEIELDALPVASLDERKAALRRLLPAIKYLPPEQREEVCARMESRIQGELPRPMMRSSQVRQMSEAGMTIGAHTRTHPILARLSTDEAVGEIQGGAEDLRAITGREVPCFAYPNGKPEQDYAAEHVRLVRDLGFTAAVSTAPGVAGAHSDPFQLPRFTPWDRSSARYIARLWHMRLTAPEAVTVPAELAREY